MAGASVSQTGTASTTAMMSACGRGWHLLKNGQSAALADWLAWPLVGPAAEQMVAQLLAAFGQESSEYAAAWTAVRARIAETWLAESGATHYVILGAGLDSYAWRQDAGHVVVEIDHPASQEWKRERMRALVLDEPEGHVWAPCDFESQSIGDVLGTLDLGSELPFVSWIGVTPYLTEEATVATLRELPPCTLAVAYCLPIETWIGRGAEMSRIFMALAEQSGEAITSLYTSSRFAELLTEAGFELLDDVGPEDALERYGHEAWSLGYERLALARKVS